MGVVASLEKPDALTGVLDMLEPRGRVFCCSEMSASRAMSLPADGYARFHIIEQGGAHESLFLHSACMRLYQRT